MTQMDPYKVYAEDSILNESPVGLIVALYEGAIDASVAARKHLASGDIPARTKAINKLVNIITELTRSLNDEKGGEVSKNLRRLYLYMQGRVLEAHTKKRVTPLEEVEKLLKIMLEGWKVADAKLDPVANISATVNVSSYALPMESASAPQYDYGYSDTAAAYGGYF